MNIKPYLSRLQRMILKCLEQNSARTQAGLAKITQYSQTSISRALAKLRLDKIVVKNKHNEYDLSAKLKNVNIKWEDVSYYSIINILKERMNLKSPVDRNTMLAELSRYEHNRIPKIDNSPIFNTAEQIKKTMGPAILDAMNTAEQIKKTMGPEILDAMNTAEQIKKTMGPAILEKINYLKNIHSTFSSNFNNTLQESFKGVAIGFLPIKDILEYRNIALHTIGINLLNGFEDFTGLSTEMIKYQNQIIRTFEIHNKLFPEPYNKKQLEKYTNLDYDINTDYLYRSTIPLLPIKEPQKREIIPIPDCLNLVHRVKSIVVILEKIDPLLSNKITGVFESLQNKETDYYTHCAVSLRSVVKILINKLAPKKKVSFALRIKKKDIKWEDQIKFMLKEDLTKNKKQYLLNQAILLPFTNKVLNESIHEGENDNVPDIELLESVINQTLEFLIILLKNIKISSNKKIS